MIPAICYHKSIQNFQPTEGKAGEVSKTPFQKKLRVVKVMLTYNIDTSNGLTNGARGDLIGVQIDDQRKVKKLIVKFEKENVGQNRRRQHPDIDREQDWVALVSQPC